MAVLVLGLLLWSLVHLTPSMAPALRARLVASRGENSYKGSFSLLLLAALALIVLGWRSIDAPDPLWQLPLWSRHLGMGLVVVAIYLFASSRQPTRINRLVRHPQLSGLITWAVAHLIINGDSRSLVLFGGLGLWALLEILFINRRDGAWEKPAVAGPGRELLVAAIAAAVTALLVLVHPWIAGVAVI